MKERGMRKIMKERKKKERKGVIKRLVVIWWFMMSRLFDCVYIFKREIDIPLLLILL